MKKLILKSIVLISSVLTISCGKSKKISYDISRFVSKPQEGVKQVAKEASEAPGIGLESVTQQKFVDPELDEISKNSRNLRQNRSQEFLDQISKAEDRIDISKVSIDSTSDGRLDLKVETIAELTKDKNALSFLSKPTENEQIPFEFISGNNSHKVKVRGYCINLQETICYDLVLEISYPLNNKIIIRQYNFKKEVPVNKKDDASENENEVKIIEDSVAVGEDPDDVGEDPDDVGEDPDDVGEDSDDVGEDLADVGKDIVVESGEQNQGTLVQITDDNKTVDHAEAHKFEIAEGGKGVYIFPDTDDIKKQKGGILFRDTGQNSNSYADLERGIFTLDESLFLGANFDLLNVIQTAPFNQSKGGYGDRLGNGYLVNSEQLRTDVDGIHATESKRARHFGSTLSISFLEWVGTEFTKKYPDSSVCVNHISRERGGEIGHKSHENGLDMDISIPSSSSDCKKKGFSRYSHYEESDHDFYKKNWDFIKLMLASNRVHVIFIDKGFIRKMCDYTETLNLNNEQKEKRKAIFKKMYHAKGHANHYHVRMVCNHQNVGCQKQGILTGATCG